ncbi:MAG: putative toxin-antitoxin system toxin component, PIN family [Caldilineaceae bacterium]|nr:putative toxin-antitoxin system toxin component, PIN family [Caldilineaceae bacterium]
MHRIRCYSGAMNAMPKPRVVLDTNVVFEGLTKRAGVAGTIVNAWYGGLITVCVTDAMVYEYVDVLSRKLSAKRVTVTNSALATLLTSAEFVTVYYRWRPSSPDPGDEFVIDCAMNANAALVTSNLKDFRLAQRTLGLQVLTPKQLLALLAK